MSEQKFFEGCRKTFKHPPIPEKQWWRCLILGHRFKWIGTLGDVIHDECSVCGEHRVTRPQPYKLLHH